MGGGRRSDIALAKLDQHLLEPRIAQPRIEFCEGGLNGLPHLGDIAFGRCALVDDDSIEEIDFQAIEFVVAHQPDAG